MESEWKETMFAAETLITNRELEKENQSNGKLINVVLRISIMKMYDPNEVDHSYMDTEMLPNMYSN